MDAGFPTDLNPGFDMNRDSQMVPNDSDIFVDDMDFAGMNSMDRFPKNGHDPQGCASYSTNAQDFFGTTLDLSGLDKNYQQEPFAHAPFGWEGDLDVLSGSGELNERDMSPGTDTGSWTCEVCGNIYDKRHKFK